MLACLLGCFTHTLSGQNKQGVQKINDYNRVFQNDATIFSLNKEAFDSLIDTSPKEYHLISTFTIDCKPCNRNIPKVLALLEQELNIQLYVLNIEDPDAIRQETTADVLRKEHRYIANSFTVSPEYGDDKWRRYNNFVDALAPRHTRYGISLFLLFNKEGSLLYASHYDETPKERLNHIKKSVKKGGCP